MISQDKGKTILDGSVNMIMSECSSLTYRLAKEVAENTGAEILGLDIYGVEDVQDIH